ncbi:MAG TPA: VIT1/CCC1 family protein [Candidatus Binataceae bacterium]|nr:VIT1/CCC1 family protein [Candidatus Binataceae bacterium]
MTVSGSRERYCANLQGEIDSAALYRTLSTIEKNPPLAQVFGRLADVEDKHAAFWKARLAATGHNAPDLRPGFRTRALEWLARRFGPAVVIPAINTLEQIDSSQYDRQPEAIAAGLPAAERSHARIIETLAASAPQGLSGGVIARLEGRHRTVGGNALRAAVLGANDGLVSNLSLVMGVAGAALNSHAILITGVAGLLAGACSMAMGEWLSVNSARESYQSQIATEATELEQVPDEEEEELVLIYQAKGIPEDQAKALAKRLIADRAMALDTLVREELGIDPGELGGSAWAAAAASFILFALGAVFPVAPFFLLANTAAVLASIVLSGATLFLIGVGTTLFTGRGAMSSGIRQLLVGFAAAGITFVIGHLIGAVITG